MTSSLEFYFDPACPWTWITSRWVVEVAEQRKLPITWQLFSLRYHNKENPGYDWIRERLNDQYAGLRVLAAVHKHHGNDAVGHLYTALGTLIHYDDYEHLTRLAEAIAAAGLPAESWDSSIEESTERGRAIVGKDSGIPIIVIDDAQHTFFGPVLSPAPTGEDALKLWDAYVTFCKIDGVYEIKRGREVVPQLGPRPQIR